jgi:hypothetical protein
MLNKLIRRGVIGGATLGMLLGLGACDSLLEVENPSVIDERDVTDPKFASAMVNAAVNEFQDNYGFLAFAGAMLSDEAVNGHNYTQWEEIDLRIIKEDNSQIADIYQYMQRARAVGDDMVGRLRKVLQAPSSSIQLATALAYTGYSYTRLGEYFCYAPVANDGEGVAIPSDAILAIADDRFDEAIRIAQAAGGNEGTRITNLARVGAARAALQRGDKTKAIAYAQQVPADFVVHVRHLVNPSSKRNYFWSATTGGNHTLGVDAVFRDLNDPRVRHMATGRTGHNQKTVLYTPAQSPAFSGWDPTVPMNVADDDLIEQIGFKEDTDMVLASFLEARYIIAEAEGMSAAELRAFIDERRAVGNQGAFTGTDAQLQAELRDQRRRDFFLSGHRLGDLRRYLEQYKVDQFPSGPHPNDEEWGWGPYGSATCFTPHRNENSNPNYP